MSENETRKQIKEQKIKDSKDKRKRDRARLRAERKYERQLSKEGRTNKSRQIEQDKYRETEKKLNWAIGIVGLLLIIVLLMVFFF